VSRPGVRDCALAALLFGASTPAASVIAEDMAPLVLAGLLYLGAAVAVLPLWLARPPAPDALRRNRTGLVVAIVAGGAVGPALLTAGLVHTPAATASLLLNFELVFTVLLAATLFREHLGRNMLAAAGLVTLAGMLLVWQPGAAATLDALLIVGACACWGLDNSVTSRIDQISPQHVTFLKGVAAGTVNLT
jgi:drug/metabolite transporter (DMT)-like permease